MLLQIEEREQEQEEARLNQYGEVSSDDTSSAPLLSQTLEHQLDNTRQQYNRSDSPAERRRSKKKISILNTAYKKAINNEKSKLTVYLPDNKSSYNNNANNINFCNRKKEELQKLTSPTNRHKIFFCNNENYEDNPESCGKYSYGRKMTQQEYKEQVDAIVIELAKKCR